MGIRMRCPQCGKALIVKDELAHRRIQCPTCQAIFSVPRGTDGWPAAPATAAAQPAGQNTSAAPCGCLAVMALVAVVALGIWWVRSAGTQTTPPPLAQAAVPTSSPGTTIPPPRTSAEPRPETPQTTTIQRDNTKDKSDSPLPAVVPKPKTLGGINGENAEAKHKELDNSKPADNPKSFLSLRALAKEFLESFETWRQAIVDPKQFLQPAFAPTEDQLVEGTEFLFDRVLGLFPLIRALGLNL